MPEHGRIPNPLDEATALALLHEGRPWSDVARELHVGYNRFRDFAISTGMLPAACRGGRRAMSEAERREEILAAQQAKREARAARKAANRAALAAATAGASPSEVAAAPHFTCAVCGGTFPIRTQGRKRAFGRRIVRLGGRDWCEKCAAARFKRRPDPYGISPEAIQ